MKNIGEAFTFVFKDPDWLTKILVGGIFVFLSMFLIGIPVLYGYCVELQQRVRRGEQYPLPEWKDVGVKFVLGFKYIVTICIYYLPLIVITVPLFLFVIFASISGSEMAGAFGGAAVTILMFCFLIPFSLFLVLLTPLISIKFAEHGSIREGLELGGVFSLFRDYWQDAMIAILISIGVGIAAAAGLILFLVGILFTSFYALLVRYHLFGQIAHTIYQSQPGTA